MSSLTLAPGPLSAPQFDALPPLSLYIHVPWCVRKCPYCDFNSHQKNGELPESEYIDALLRDFMDDLPWIHEQGQGREIGSIFFGGGSPRRFGRGWRVAVGSDLGLLYAAAGEIGTLPAGSVVPAFGPAG